MFLIVLIFPLIRFPLIIQYISAAAGLILFNVQLKVTSVLAATASDKPVIIISSLLGGTERDKCCLPEEIVVELQNFEMRVLSVVVPNLFCCR